MPLDFRPQAEARPRWELDPDYLAGLRQCADNNQPLMALMYAAKALEEQALTNQQLVLQINELREQNQQLTFTLTEYMKDLNEFEARLSSLEKVKAPRTPKATEES